MAIGALHISSTLSLCAEAGEPPLRYRFLSLTANFSTSTVQFPNLPIFSTALQQQNSFRQGLQILHTEKSSTSSSLLTTPFTVSISQMVSLSRCNSEIFSLQNKWLFWCFSDCCSFFIWYILFCEKRKNFVILLNYCSFFSPPHKILVLKLFPILPPCHSGSVLILPHCTTHPHTSPLLIVSLY